MSNIFKGKWDSDIVVGDEVAPKPPMIGFRNSIDALEMLHKHLERHSNIVVHCDVDGDGIGCGYELKSLFNSIGNLNNSLFVINKEKEHGIEQRHVDFFNQNNAELVIIVDSSTNEVELIKNINCDVLVVDHHEINHDNTIGDTKCGKYVIINNMLDNREADNIDNWIKDKNSNTQEDIAGYIADERMSCGLVLYELLRLYCEAYDYKGLLERIMLYQWVGVTLFTDAIPLISDRNQWYIENTVHSDVTEPTLKVLLNELNKYKFTVDKNFINYTLGPTINKAIRAGKSGMVLDIVLHRPFSVKELSIYSELQSKAIETTRGCAKLYNDYVMGDITNTEVSKSYCGVIATKLVDEHEKNSVVYKVEDGLAVGSFRGRYSGVDYIKYFSDYKDYIYAQGHKPAFGFKVYEEDLHKILSGLKDIEPIKSLQYYITMGNVPLDKRGIYHVSNIDNFKRQGYLLKLAMANSKLSSEESLSIVADRSDLHLVEQRGKLYIYEIFGLRCKAFSEINSNLISIYAEYNSEIELFVRELKVD